MIKMHYFLWPKSGVKIILLVVNLEEIYALSMLVKRGHFELAQCDQIWRNSATLANMFNIFKIYLVLGKVFNSLWHNLYAFGQLFIAVNGQILKTQSGHLVTLLGNYVPQPPPKNLARFCFKLSSI